MLYPSNHQLPDSQNSIHSRAELLFSRDNAKVELDELQQLEEGHKPKDSRARRQNSKMAPAGNPKAYEAIEEEYECEEFLNYNDDNDDDNYDSEIVLIDDEMLHVPESAPTPPLFDPCLAQAPAPVPAPKEVVLEAHPIEQSTSSIKGDIQVEKENRKERRYPVRNRLPASQLEEPQKSNQGKKKRGRPITITDDILPADWTRISHPGDFIIAIIILE